MNICILAGRLTSNPEKRFLDQDVSVVGFGLAVPRRVSKKKEMVDFFQCEAWYGLGDTIDKYFRKGDGIVVHGRFQNNFYTNRDGVKVREYKLVVEDFEFGPKKRSSESGNDMSYGNEIPNNSYEADPGDGFMNIPDGIDEELPFS